MLKAIHGPDLSTSIRKIEFACCAIALHKGARCDAPWNCIRNIRKSAHFGARKESVPQYDRRPPMVTLVHALMEKVHLAGCNASEWTCWPLYSVAGQRARRTDKKLFKNLSLTRRASHEKLHTK